MKKIIKHKRRLYEAKLVKKILLEVNDMYEQLASSIDKNFPSK